MFSNSEENYLKAIYKLEEDFNEAINTNLIADIMETKASSVTDMLKKLAVKDLVIYEKYKGVSLSAKGKKVALTIIRKHRLWESFLVEKLGFNWDEVHEIAEQLEHIQSEELVNRLDEFLAFPKKDPHGDPIPDKDGKITISQRILLSNASIYEKYIVVGVNDSSSSFLKYLEKNNIILGSHFQVLSFEEYDNSLTILLKDNTFQLSEQIAKKIYILKQK